ncbi:MAG TPA: DUF3078 domain-containing protein, partial [Bacteroidales bacterium]|nr:DUF3078 domain-containing protein [Bacteroidales bacterium]
MNRITIILLTLLIFSINLYSQDDSLKIIQKTELTDSSAFIYVNDSLRTDSLLIDKFQSDSIILEPLTKDTLKLTPEEIIVQVEHDSLPQLQLPENFTDSLKTTDTSFITQSILTDSLLYQEFIGKLNDSLIFEKPDTSWYVSYKLNHLLNSGEFTINDTIERAIRKLIYFYQNQKTDHAIDYLKYKLDSSGQLISLKNKKATHLSDSLRDALVFLLQNIPEDSLSYTFYNSMNDSVNFDFRENEIDSVHFKLYDHRGEHVLLWIKKSDKNAFDLFLEDGVYLEKTRQQRIVEQGIDVNLKFPKLRKVRKTNIIVPIWELKGLADIKFNQGYLSNWAEGGENSMSALSVFKFSADYNYGRIKSFDSDIEYRLGYLKLGDKPLQKNDDRLEINAKYGRTAFNNWYYSALVNFKTQFLKGYEYPNDSVAISQFMAPGYLVFSLGLDYKPSNKLTILVSPLTSKFTIMADTTNFDQTRYGLSKDEKIRKEIGAYIKAISKIKFNHKISLENKLTFFTNYTNNPQNIDVDWEADLSVALTDYIKLSVNAHMIYDDDVDFPVLDDAGNQIGT